MVATALYQNNYPKHFAFLAKQLLFYDLKKVQTHPPQSP